MKVGVDYIGISTPFMCHDGNGNFLLSKRSEKCRDEQGKWEFGGGQLHFGEEPHEGVLREVSEEYGCVGEILEQLPARSLLREFDGVKTHWLIIPFVIKVNREEVKLNEPEMITEIGWFKLDQLPTPFHSGSAFGLKLYAHRLEKYK